MPITTKNCKNFFVFQGSFFPLSVERNLRNSFWDLGAAIIYASPRVILQVERENSDLVFAYMMEFDDFEGWKVQDMMEINTSIGEIDTFDKLKTMVMNNFWQR